MTRARTAVALILLSACGRAPAPGPTATATPAPTVAPGPYDPRTDPLVNPPSMYEPAPADPAAIAWDDILYRHLEGNPANLNPIFVSSINEFYLSGLLFTHSLFGFDKDMSWMVDPLYVDHFEEAADHLSYTVKMKPGLKWHDGHALNAHDVVYTFYEIIDDRVPCPATKSGKEEVAKVEALDDLTVKITFKQALATNKWNAGWSLLPKHLYEKGKQENPDLKTGDYYNELNRKPIGNGPYKFVEWIENDRIVLERWDDYPGPRPAFQRIVFRIIPDLNVALLSFNKGDIDEFRMQPKQFATQTLVGSDYAKVGYKVFQPEWSYSYIVWNQDGSNPFFTDKNVRYAMTLACDIERVNRELAYNLYQPASGPFHPNSWMYDKSIQRLPFDLDRAGALLDEAGWKLDEARGGWRHKTIDGKPVKFEFTMRIPQAAQISIDLAAIYQEDLKSIGVDMKTEILEWATFIEGNRKHEFQASIANWGTGVDPDLSGNIWRSDQYVKDGSSGRNYGGFKNARVDELFTLGRVEFDPQKRAAIYQEVGRILYEEQPYTFLWYRGVYWGLNQRIRGVTAGPRGIFNFDPAERAWWVPAAAAKVPLDAK